MPIDIGLTEEQRAQSVQALKKLLGETYALYAKTHGYHWNVTGPRFNELHAMFMTQYTELWAALDEIAERIRALGSPAPGSYTQFAERASVKEDTTVPKAEDMIKNLVADFGKVVESARAVVRAGEAAGDDASVDLGVRRIELHEKGAWMLGAHLE